MKKYLRTIACIVGGFAGLMFSFSTLASGNGGGAEPPPKGNTERSSVVCAVAPWLCAVTIDSGNGGGNEPPPKKG